MDYSKEKKALSSLLACLDGLDKHDFIDLKQNNIPYKEGMDKEIEKRIEYLKYGFASRSRSVLENTFPETKIILGDSEWMRLGKEYAYNYAPKYVNINQIGEGFPKFLNKKIPNSLATESSRFEINLYFSSISSTGNFLTKENFSNLHDNSVLRLCPHVKIFSGYLDVNSSPWSKLDYKKFYVIHRVDRVIRTFTLQEKIAKTLSLFKKPLRLSDLTKKNISQSQIIETLTTGIQNSVFEEISNIENI